MPRPQIIKRSAFEPGSHIFIFRHSRTNQVVYSLHHNLDDKNAKNIHAQLPFLGKKTKPAEIRTDLWRPYARVDFPEALVWKGLLAYRKLREYQMLRYYSWRTKGQISPISKKDRVIEIMDQSRTSVADLANVLSESEGWETARKDKEERNVQRQKNRLDTIWRWTLSLAEQGKAGKIEEAQEAVTKARNSRETIQARQEVNKYRRASEAVDVVNGAQIDEVARSRWNADIAAMVEYKLTGTIAGYTDAQGLATDAETAEPSVIPEHESGRTMTTTEPRSGVEAVTETLQELNPLSSIPAVTSIQIRWEDIRDAQWAQSWPVTIQHDQIGFAKRGMPFGGRTKAPAADPAEARGMGWTSAEWVKQRQINSRRARQAKPPSGVSKLDPEARQVLESMMLDEGNTAGMQRQTL